MTAQERATKIMKIVDDVIGADRAFSQHAAIADAIREAVAEERAACAKLAEDHDNKNKGRQHENCGIKIAELIRKRGLSQ